MRRSEAVLLLMVIFGGLVGMGYYGVTGHAPWIPSDHGCPRYESAKDKG